MASPMLKMLKQQNPDKTYPSNTGQKWTEDEEIRLLEELNKNMDIITIAEIHNRTPGGINARRKEIAYKMYLQGITMEKIIKKTKLDKSQISDTITRRENQSKIEKVIEPINTQSSEITELKNEIIGLKKDVREMLRLIHELYDFETQ